MLVACDIDNDPETDYEGDDDRDTAIDDPLDFAEPEEVLEVDPADESELTEIEAATGDSTSVATYHILQWNIAGGKVHDCRTPAITAAVRKLVKDNHIEFVGLNEVCPAQYDSIRAALRELWGKAATDSFSVYTGDSKPRVVGDAIFGKRNFDQITRRELGNDKYGSRNLTCGQLAARQHLRICSTHLSVSHDQARSQLRQVHHLIEAWWTNRRDTVFLTGDFNLEPNDPAFDAIYAADSSTRHNPNNHGAFEELDDADANSCRGYGERTLPGTAGGPCHEGAKIDFIFARRNRIKADNYGSDALNIPTTCGGACSDHRPLRGRVRAIVRVD